MDRVFTSTFDYKLIYIFRINDEAHKGYLKIGETTIHTATAPELLTPLCSELNKAAKERINSYTSTAGIKYDLLHTELAIRIEEGVLKAFSDKAVHSVLLRSNIERHYFDTECKQNEWFAVDLETAINAIQATKECRSALHNAEKSMGHDPIELRPEQEDAIRRTITKYSSSNRMLWNAKMRFGKTISALEVAKRMGSKKTIICTHRPVVGGGWAEDFGKIFYEQTTNYIFSSKSKGLTLEEAKSSGKNFVYFASIQDLRGSDIVGGKHNKNIEIFDTDWDYVIIDEAHEGTKTQLGDNIKILLFGKSTKVLELSGTPYNLLDSYKESEIYTWDYVMEQSAKMDWDKYHYGDHNPYEELPRLNIFTYNLNDVIKNYEDVVDKSFNFREFFRVWTGNVQKDKKHLPNGVKEGDFVHEEDVKSFLGLISKRDTNSNYPFSTSEYQDYFRHTLWMVPGVKEAKALSALLKKDTTFGSGAFEIVNVAGDGDEEVQNDEALKMVNKAIGDNPDETYTITISCGRLTTGVSVKPWTAVLMLSGSYTTAASTYMQTIFRVQTSANINGRIKSECYVFDFAPDRTLKILAETSNVSSKAGKTTKGDRAVLGEFLNFCPVIAISGSQMRKYNVDNMLQQLKQVYTERVIRNGFDDRHIYNDNLRNLNEIEVSMFAHLKDVLSSSKQTKKSKGVVMAKSNLTDDQRKHLEQLQNKPKKELTDEEKILLEEKKERDTLRRNAESILRGIAIRIPLLIYGADIPLDEDITVENFTSLIKDDASWEEFMPRGVTKEMFNDFSKYFDSDVFVAAGRKIREQARDADDLPPTERVKRIAEIFNTFKNPDKETVLTPWRVVNMHLGDCLGGWNFYDPNYDHQLDEPRFIDHGDVTADTLANTSARILEINSKTGLYPLYVVYSIFRKRCEEYDESLFNEAIERELWFKTVAENMYVICKTPMAKQITKRTLLGYKSVKSNARYFEDLLNQIKNKTESFIKTVTNGSKYCSTNTERNMKFNAVVGNPPYQEEGISTRKKPIYHLFYDVAFQLSDKVSLITPGRFLFRAGQTPKKWMDTILDDKHFKVVRFFKKSTDVFSSVDIKGGVAITYRDAKTDFGKISIFSEFEELKSITKKVYAHLEFSKCEFSNLISSQGIYKFTELLFKDHPEAYDVQGKGTASKITSNSFENLTDVFLKDAPKDKKSYVQMIGRSDNKRMYRWIDKSYVQTVESSCYYRVLVAESNGTGMIGEVLSTPIIIMPMIGHTDTFLSIGKFDSQNEAKNCIKYIRSKFTRSMLGTLKATQHNPRDTWANVPLQDFKETSDIDWSKPIKEIDSQLYKKYNLTPDEITFIESTIKPM